MSKDPISERDVELARRISENHRIDVLEEQYKWMTHYHEELKQMYKIFQENLKDNHVKIEVSFDEFRMFVYQNTERYFDFKKHKKIRPLI